MAAGSPVSAAGKVGQQLIEQCHAPALVGRCLDGPVLIQPQEEIVQLRLSVQRITAGRCVRKVALEIHQNVGGRVRGQDITPIGGTVGDQQHIPGTQHRCLGGKMVTDSAGEPQNEPVGIFCVYGMGIGNASDDTDQF